MDESRLPVTVTRNPVISDPPGRFPFQLATQSEVERIDVEAEMATEASPAEITPPRFDHVPAPPGDSVLVPSRSVDAASHVTHVRHVRHVRTRIVTASVVSVVSVVAPRICVWWEERRGMSGRRKAIFFLEEMGGMGG